MTSTSASTTVTLYSPGGYLNRFRNGTMDVWQRGTSALATSSGGAYTADGWIVAQSGAVGTCAQDTGYGGPLYSLKCVGNTSNTDTTFAQRIESSVAAPLAGNTVTVQFWYKQTSGSAITPKISTCYASATDNFATCTGDLSASNLTSCATNTWCQESYTLSVSASATQGYQVKFDCNTGLTNAQFCWMTAADIRVTPAVSTGVNTNPPPPELRPVHAELAFCERYLFVAPTGWIYIFVGVNSGTAQAYASQTTAFPVTMRIVPTPSSVSFTNSNTSGSTQIVVTSSSAGYYTNANNPPAIGNSYMNAGATYSAEL
jgi:hypothetical protein